MSVDLETRKQLLISLAATAINNNDQDDDEITALLGNLNVADKVEEAASLVIMRPVVRPQAFANPENIQEIEHSIVEAGPVKLPVAESKRKKNGKIPENYRKKIFEKAKKTQRQVLKLSKSPVPELQGVAEKSLKEIKKRRASPYLNLSNKTLRIVPKASQHKQDKKYQKKRFEHLLKLRRSALENLTPLIP